MSQAIHRALAEHDPSLDRAMFRRATNSITNAVKRADVPSEDLITMPSVQPFLYIVRAIKNYESLMGEITPQMQQFRERKREEPKP